MARDWNGDGKITAADRAVDYAIFEDIYYGEEAEKNKSGTSEWGAGNSGKKAYSNGDAMSEGEWKALVMIGKWFVMIAVVIGFAANVFGLFTGYVSIPGLLITGAIIVIWAVRKIKEKQKETK